METWHLILEFLSFLLALFIAGAGVLKFIDKKFEDQEIKTAQSFRENNAKIQSDFKTIWDKVDGNKKESKEDLKDFVRIGIHDKEIQYLKELSEASVKSLLTVLQSEINHINDKLDTLIKHEEKRNGNS